MSNIKFEKAQKGFYKVFVDGVKIGTVLKMESGWWKGESYDNAGNVKSMGDTRKEAAEMLVERYEEKMVEKKVAEEAAEAGEVAGVEEKPKKKQPKFIIKDLISGAFMAEVEGKGAADREFVRLQKEHPKRRLHLKMKAQ